MPRSLVAICLVSAVLAVLLTLGMSTTQATRGADPSPSIAPLASPIFIDPLDPRAGAGANRVGAPLTAALLVLGAGTLAIVVTFAYVKLTRRA